MTLFSTAFKQPVRNIHALFQAKMPQKMHEYYARAKWLCRCAT
jgi:hypothetical protein